MINLQTKRFVVGLTLAVLLVFAALIAAFGVLCPQTAEAATSSSSIDSYYSNLNTDFTGEAFRLELQKLLKNGHNPTTYKELWNVYEKADRDPNNSDNILLFYTSESRKYSSGNSNGVNREHVWAQSLGNFGTSNAGADGHHLMPCDSTLNSTRGNKGFDDVTALNGTKIDGCYYNSSYFCPTDEYKGVVARILMYVQVRWGGEGNTLKFADYSTKSGANAIGKISTLLKWHFMYPPTQREIDRNTAVQKIQGNRNPFVDHPEYAAMIYGYNGGYYVNETAANNSIAAVKKYYKGAEDPTPDEPTPTEKYVSYVYVNGTPTTKTYVDGEKFNSDGLEVKVIYSDGSVGDIDNKKCQWLDSNTGMETLSEGTTAVVCRCENVDSDAIVGLTVVSSSKGQNIVTISYDSLPPNTAYGWLDWNANGISGKAYVTTAQKSFQMNNSKEYYYIYNSTALTGGIKSVTMNGQGEWELRVNDTPYDDTSKKYPQTGTSIGKKNLDNGEAKWTIEGDCEYFTLNYVGSGKTIVDSIVITYGSGSETVDNDFVRLDALLTKIAVGQTTKIGLTASSNTSYVSSDENVVTVDAQGNIKAVSKGVATVVISCGNAKARFLVVVQQPDGGKENPTPNPSDPPVNDDDYPKIGCFGIVSASGLSAMTLMMLAAYVVAKKR